MGVARVGGVDRLAITRDNRYLIVKGKDATLVGLIQVRGGVWSVEFSDVPQTYVGSEPAGPYLSKLTIN